MGQEYPESHRVNLLLLKLEKLEIELSETKREISYLIRMLNLLREIDGKRERHPPGEA